jgi:hypothetical protein
MSRRAYTSTTARPPRVTYTPSPTLSPDDTRRRRTRAYRLLLGLDSWPTPTDRQA